MDLMRRISTRLVDGERALRVWLWVSLACNMGIVVTGAVVRLTASGLGCSEWPRCTPETWVPTPEAGLHGAIEFGNRLLTFVLMVAAIGAFAAAWRNRGRGTTLWRLTLAVGIGIPLQGVIGGFTVWSGLNPFVVALHLLLSAALIVLCVWALSVAYRPSSPATRSARLVAVAAFAATMLSVWAGTVTTGSGPHAGDADAPRTGFDLDLVTRLHAVSGWLVAALAIAAVAVTWRAQPRVATAARAFLAVVAAQGLIGYVQYFLGLPAVLVAAHMVGLTLVTAAASHLLFTTLTGVSRDQPGAHRT